MHRIRRLALVLVGAAACSRSPQPPEPPVSAHDVAAVRAGEALAIRNQGSDPLALSVFDRDFAARALFSPCIDPGSSCVRLPAGGELRIPVTKIAGYSPSTREVVVYTWRVVADGRGGFRADSVQARVVSF